MAGNLLPRAARPPTSTPQRKALTRRITTSTLRPSESSQGSFAGLRFASGRQTILRGARPNLFRELKFGNQAETRKVKKRSPHFMMLTIASRKENRRRSFQRQGAFPGGLVKQNGQWQLAARQSSAVKIPQHSPN